jgi:branched-chain amino acid aminotransferase
VIETRNLSRQTAPDYSLDPTTLEFGRQCTPNFFICEYRRGEWGTPRIEALHNFALHPASNVFHYGQAIFEGLKAYRQQQDRVVLFRPEMNAKRFEDSAIRMGMPPVREELFVEACRQLSDLERPFIPEAPGTLYLRPTMIGTEPCLGVRSSSDFLFYIIALPSGAYFKEMREGTGTVRVFVAESSARAADGGTGGVKAAANYAVTLKTISDAKEKGCSQVLFLDAARHHRVEELGGMNVCFVRNGELITPRLNGTILPGVTRDSLLTLAADLGYAVEEGKISTDEWREGNSSGAITEVFACGTAAVITPVGSVKSAGAEWTVGDGAPGQITMQLREHLTGIQTGQLDDTHGWMHSLT